MIEDLTRKAAVFVQGAITVPERVTRSGLSPQERKAAELIENLVDMYGVEIFYEARERMPGNHPLRNCISITRPVGLVVDDFEATLRAGDISTNNPPSCPDRSFRLVAEVVSDRLGRPGKVLTLANVDPDGRVTGRGRQRLGLGQLEGLVSVVRLMAQNLESRAREEADKNWKIFHHITA